MPARLIVAARAGPREGEWCPEGLRCAVGAIVGAGAPGLCDGVHQHQPARLGHQPAVARGPHPHDARRAATAGVPLGASCGADAPLLRALPQRSYHVESHSCLQLALLLLARASASSHGSKLCAPMCAQGTDALGQQYLTPDIVIGQQGSDVIIVGRARCRLACSPHSAPRWAPRSLLDCVMPALRCSARCRVCNVQGIIAAKDVAAAAMEYKAAGWKAHTDAL